MTVVAVFAVLNERLGVVGGYTEVVERATGARTAIGWKGLFLSGCSFGSPASFVATATFMATAVAATFAIRWLVG